MRISQYFLTQPSQFYTGIILIPMCLILLESIIAIPKASSYTITEIDKNNGMNSLQKRPAFFIGSRFGRSSSNYASGTAATMGTSKSRRLMIVPRNERFFLNSRYGKRNGKSMTSPYRKSTTIRCSSAAKTKFVCLLPFTYLGINKFYRIKDQNFIAHARKLGIDPFNKYMG